MTTKLTAAQARGRVNAAKVLLVAMIPHPSEREAIETMIDLGDQLADALERADNNEQLMVRVAQESNRRLYRAEQAESRLKEAMREFHPGEWPQGDVCYRDEEGELCIRLGLMDDEDYKWYDAAVKFERAFGVKVEEWKP
jgi:hypothetical protein